jgi:hypothetical protein
MGRMWEGVQTKTELKTDRRCADGRKIALNFHTNSMKSYKGKLTLHSAVRYSVCSLNERHEEKNGTEGWRVEGNTVQYDDEGGGRERERERE